MPTEEPAPEKIRFRCPQCEVKLAAPARRAGATIKCPKCSHPTTVPELDRAGGRSPEAPPPADAPIAERSEWALARCPECDDVLKVKRAHFGDPVVCPSCESQLIVDGEG